MAEKLGLGNEVRQLKIGQSFTNPKSSAFHTIKYDFKPASVDTNKIASVDVARNNEVTVTVPHLDGAGVPQTVFKGNHRPYQKECVLIIDRVTGEITLEKLACNMQVKKTRSESAKVPLPQDRLSDRSGANSLAARSQTPPVGTPVGTRTSSKTKVTSGKSRRHDRIITQIVPKHSPLHASPGYPSPSHHKSPKRDILHETHTPNNNSSALASLPMIGIDDFDMAPQSSSANTTMNAPSSQQQHQIHNNHNHMPPPSTTDRSPPVSVRLTPPESRGEVGEITDTSSSSSDSDSDSDPDRTVVAAAAGRSGSSFSKTNGHHPPNGNTAPPTSSSSNNQAKLATHLLNEDLCLSESGSDSD